MKFKDFDDYFSYDYLECEFSEDELDKNLKSNHLLFTKIAKNWNHDHNSEWIVRNYLAVKMILASSVMLTSARYADDQNLKIVRPYLNYYALLNCCRAIIYTSPIVEFNNGDLFQMTHKKTINIVGDILAKFNKDIGAEIALSIDKAREYREVFSYKFPATGAQEEHISTLQTIEICTFLCQVAQFQSRILENTTRKKVTEKFDLEWSTLTHGFRYDGDHFKIFDDEDYHRLNYISRKQKKPISLHLTMTEGLVEDFFGAWCPDEDYNTEGLYNPDDDWRIIFPVP